MNIVIRDYLEISFTRRLDRIETSRLSGFCSIRVFRERYFRSVHSSKILLLLNYFIFVNLFESATFSDHCPTFLKFVQDGYFPFLEMPVNLNQYRAAIEVFNNWILITSKKHYYFSETSNMKSNLLFTTIINVVVLVFIYFMFKAFFNQKNWKHRFTLTALSFLFFTFFVYHPWLFIRLIKIGGDVEENPEPKRYSA